MKKGFHIIGIASIALLLPLEGCLSPNEQLTTPIVPVPSQPEFTHHGYYDTLLTEVELLQVFTSEAYQGYNTLQEQLLASSDTWEMAQNQLDSFFSEWEDANQKVQYHLRQDAAALMLRHFLLTENTMADHEQLRAIKRYSSILLDQTPQDIFTLYPALATLQSTMGETELALAKEKVLEATERYLIRVERNASKRSQQALPQELPEGIADVVQEYETKTAPIRLQKLEEFLFLLKNL